MYNKNEHDIQVSCYRWYKKLGSESDMKIDKDTVIEPESIREGLFRIATELTEKYQEERENGV